MPHLVKMDKKYRSKGLTLVGAQCQKASPKELQDYIEKHDVEFPIAQNGTTPNKIKDLPHMLVFDVNGKCVFSGSHEDDEFEDAIKDALKEVILPEEEGDDPFTRKELVAERDWINTDGNKLTASLLSLDGNTGTFRKPNGQTFEYDITKLSDADQEAIQAAIPKEKEE